MKQIEITVKVNNTLKEVDNILTNEGFKMIRKSLIDDKYMVPNKLKVNKRNILRVLSKCVLIRYLKTETDEFKKLTYKKKEYDGNKVLSEVKTNVNIDNIDKAYELFVNLDYSLLVRVKYDVIVYEKDGLELAFQDVDKLGLLLEVENTNDFEGKSANEINKEKRNMVKKLNELHLNVSKDYDIKKAYELIKKGL